MSELRKALHDYLVLRRALGFKLTSQGILLQSFVDYADRQGVTVITRDFCLRWALSSPHGKLTYCARTPECGPQVCGVSSRRRPSNRRPAARIIAGAL